MMSERLHEESFEALAAAYFDEALDEAGLAELRSMLHADDRRVKRLAALAQLEQMIGSEIAYQHEAHRFGLSVSPNDNASASASALAELASLYEDGLQDPMNFATWREEQANQARADRFAAWRNRMMIGGAIASLVAVVSVLAVVFIGGEASIVQTAEQVTDDQPVGPIDPVERNERVVATLTAANQALWATSSGNAAPAPGDTLHAGQRLVLTQGFAEITTEEGAVVILEAPATVELFDNDNAIRLHAGKLVGICETESSKGFLVRAPHMDITDLGTRFGVDASQSDKTEMLVFEGSVLARTSDRNAALPIVVSAEQAYSATAGKLTAVVFEPEGFDFGQFIDRHRPRFGGLPIVWRGDVVADLRPGQQVSPALQVFLESKNRPLGYNAPVQVNAQVSWPNTNIDQPTIPGLTRCDMYLLHMDRASEQPLQAGDGEFVLHFDRPIHGVMLSSRAINLAYKRFAKPGMIYPTEVEASEEENARAPRGLNQGQPPERQEITEIFNDGKSLRLRLDTTDNAVDQLRIFVEPLDLDD